MKSKEETKRLFEKLPIVFDWVEYKGETVFAGINFDATMKANKPMMDIFYCATAALNHTVLKTVQWDKKKFHPSKLALCWKPHLESKKQKV